jgi:putative NADH-flavin reductase
MALARGHPVTAFVRDPATLPTNSPLLRSVQGDATLDHDAVAEAVRGSDVVISALGRGRSFKPEGLIERASKVLVSVLQREGVRRLIFTSAFGLGDTRAGIPLLPRLMRATLLRNIYADKEAGESIIRESGLDWTFVHPTGLTDGPLTGTYRAGAMLPLRGFPTISRADVAHCLLSQVDDPSFIRKTVLISA